MDDDRWKMDRYARTVPLHIVALRGSMPPSWGKDFVSSQGRRLKLCVEFYGSLGEIFADLSSSLRTRVLNSKSTMAADLITIGDSWLSCAIKKAIIEPIKGVEHQDWFKELSERWKAYLRRNMQGEVDSNGHIWAAPYRWGCTVIAFKRRKFEKYKLDFIEDWEDLWRPELAGKIVMVDNPREVVGAVLKYMGASYNTKHMDAEVSGGRNAVLENLTMLSKQVLLFDCFHYLQAFTTGDVWVAVGWSSDVLPAAKCMSDVTVIVPKSGASLWADMWAIPAASKFQTSCVGSGVRGPSPLIHQWMEFCLQSARALPFKQQVIPGSSPHALSNPARVPVKLTTGSILETNLVHGAPPPEILAKCEFLEPLSEAALADYKWLIASLEKPRPDEIMKIT